MGERREGRRGGWEQRHLTLAWHGKGSRGTVLAGR